MDKLTGEKFGSEYLRSVGFLKGAYFCSRTGFGKIKGEGAALAAGGPAGETDGTERTLDCPGVNGGNGDAEPAGTNAGGGGKGGRILPGAKGGAPGGGIPGGMRPGGKGKPGGGCLYNKINKKKNWSKKKREITLVGNRSCQGMVGMVVKRQQGEVPPGKMEAHLGQYQEEGTSLVVACQGLE